MTTAEAIAILRRIQEPETWEPQINESAFEALDMAISALEAQDGDAISRQDAIDFIDAGRFVNPNEPRWSDNEVINFLKSRPSAQPERKKGKWIMYAECDCLKCDQCGMPSINAQNFCCGCGADMRGEQDENQNC